MKRLTNYIADLGRVVAFYPNLREITEGSLTASILLCQLIYWTDKTKNGDGWIWKNSDEIREETSLTYYEQKTARDILVSLGFVEEQNRRLEHKFYFKVNQDKINEAWENREKIIEPEIFKPSEEVKEKEQKELKEKPQSSIYQEEAIEIKEKIIVDGKETTRTRITHAKPQGDWVDAQLKFAQSPGMKKIEGMREIKEKIEQKWNINVPPTGRWEKFLKFAYERQLKHNESIDTFMSWAMSQPGFDPVYWSPERMISLYPQAFLEFEKVGIREDFVEKLPEYQEDPNIIPMPDFVKKRKILPE